jgi:hypothetical protein
LYTPASFVQPLTQNQSCDPYTPRSSQCAIGNEAEYAVNVTRPEHITTTLRFVHEKNIRLAIKSTGHDLLGKSTGKGSLGLWLHHLNRIDFHEHNNTFYSGPAVTIGSGIQSWEIFEAAAKHNLRVVGGTCPTVSVAGGFSQGGGHSLLSSTYGLSADNILAWEVVLANGSHVIATPHQYTELYFALSGGGGGTYAVVLSVTVKAFPESRTGFGAVSILYTSSGIKDEVFWQAVNAFHTHFPSWVDAGGVITYTIMKDLFYLRPLTFPDKTIEEVRNLTWGFTNQLDQLQIQYQVNFTSFPTYLEHFDHYFGPLPFGPYGAAEVQGSRLIPRSLISGNSTSKLVNVMRNITASSDFMMIGVGLNVPIRPGAPATGLNPYWRDTILHLSIHSDWDFSLPWKSQVAKQALVTDQFIPALERLTPGNTATYGNEGDADQPNWKAAYFGNKYEILREIKKKYDEHDIFYAPTAVGSDEWLVEKDGRLCRKT